MTIFLIDRAFPRSSRKFQLVIRLQNPFHVSSGGAARLRANPILRHPAAIPDAAGNDPSGTHMKSVRPSLVKCPTKAPAGIEVRMRKEAEKTLEKMEDGHRLVEEALRESEERYPQIPGSAWGATRSR